jgi:electron transport complex protein RnfB
MFDQVYRELARKLDSIPPGFPATESGVELQLLARLYTREEATIVTAMRLTYEAAGDIAARAAIDSGAAYDILNGAARKGLVRARLGEQGRTFALKPQTGGLVGYSYEQVLRRADAKAAELYVQWIEETRGGGLSDFPAARRVIAVEEAIPFRQEIHPYEQAREIWYVSTTVAQLGLEFRVENARFIDWNQRLLQDSQVLVRVKGRCALHP